MPGLMVCTPLCSGQNATFAASEDLVCCDWVDVFHEIQPVEQITWFPSDGFFLLEVCFNVRANLVPPYVTQASNIF